MCIIINGDFYHTDRCEDFVNIYFCGRQLEGNILYIHNHYLHFDADKYWRNLFVTTVHGAWVNKKQKITTMHFSNCYHLLSQAIILHVHDAWGAFTFHVHLEPICIVVNYHGILLFFHIAFHHCLEWGLICAILYV